MPYKGTLGGKAIETSVSIALENAFRDYVKYNSRTINWQSRGSAFKARKALKKIKELAQLRRLELLTLYSTDPKSLAKQP